MEQTQDRDPRHAKTEEKPKEKPKELPANQKDPVDEASDKSFPASDPPASY
jgi:hypothetical protein